MFVNLDSTESCWKGSDRFAIRTREERKEKIREDKEERFRLNEIFTTFATFSKCMILKVYDSQSV